ncbi:MAG: GspH/FimT family pseudopilin [Hydrogenophaga sp.]
MRQAHSQGLTLVEITVVLVILAIIGTFAMPAWQEMVAKQRRESLASQLMAHMALARSTAISKGRTVALSTRGNGWHSGWTVHQEILRNGRWDAGETVYAQHSGDSHTRMVGNGSMAHYVMFDADGRPVQSGGGFLAGTLQVWLRSS